MQATTRELEQEGRVLQHVLVRWKDVMSRIVLWMDIVIYIAAMLCKRRSKEEKGGSDSLRREKETFDLDFEE